MTQTFLTATPGWLRLPGPNEHYQSVFSMVAHALPIIGWRIVPLKEGDWYPQPVCAGAWLFENHDGYGDACMSPEGIVYCEGQIHSSAEEYWRAIRDGLIAR